MREIEFRGKRVDNGEWVYGSLLKDKDEYYYIVNDYGGFRTATEVIYETTGQYTGVKDKNEKKIYEGDILIDYYGTKRFVGFKYGSFVYTNTPKVVDQVHNTFSIFSTELNNYISKEWEVIGNIHDNPELLNKE